MPRAALIASALALLVLGMAHRWRPLYPDRMGTASHRKKVRREALRSRPGLARKLREQSELLEVYGQSYDEGRKVAAYPLAVCIRVLVHQTAVSTSLLDQLNVKGSMTFLDTALHIDPRNLIPSHAGLSVMQLTMGVGSTWVPRHVAQADQPNPPLRFEPWWSSVVVRDATREVWTRQRMVLELASREGGAHVDPKQSVDLKALEEDNSMGWTHSDPIVGTEQAMLNGPLVPSVRQIAYELQSSLQTHCSELLRE